MDTERIETLASLISAETERRLIKEILGELTPDERATLRTKALDHALEAIRNKAQVIDYNLQREIENDLQSRARKIWNEKYLADAEQKADAALRHYLTPTAITKVIDSVAPAALSAAVKKVVDRVANQIALAKPA